MRSEDATAPLTAEVVRSLVEHHREFLRFVESRVGSRELAKEIVQEAFTRSIDKVDTLRDEGAAVAWFYRSLRNAVIDHHRRQQVSQKMLAAFAAELETHGEPPEGVRSVICQCVSRLAGTLKPEYAEALEQIEVGGMSVAAFAERHGISANNAAVRVFRAREALRKRVETSCGTCADHGCLDCTCGSKPG